MAAKTTQNFAPDAAAASAVLKKRAPRQGQSSRPYPIVIDKAAFPLILSTQQPKLEPKPSYAFHRSDTPLGLPHTLNSQSCLSSLHSLHPDAEAFKPCGAHSAAFYRNTVEMAITVLAEGDMLSRSFTRDYRQLSRYDELVAELKGVLEKI